MKIDKPKYGIRSRNCAGAIGAVILGLWLSSSVHAFTVSVVDQDGNPITSGFRWQLEEDRTHHVTPGTVGTQLDPPQSLTFHASHHPVATQGEENGALSGSIALPKPDTRYFLSILPYNGYTLSGAVVPANIGAGEVIDVVVSELPIPTAQISIFLFEDNSPVNGAPDLPTEAGINGTFEGFKILVEDAGGGYGISSGTLLEDAFGNPLGTTYNPDGTVLAIGDGSIPINSDGVGVVQNLYPGKYGIQIIPPAGSDWEQTSTIEGSKVIDAWVKANEPSFFVEFGPPGHHVFVGFVHKNTNTIAALGAPVSGPITGTITNNHLERPPTFGANSGNAFPECLVAVNEELLVGGNTIYVTECDADSNFTIPSLPAGNYLLSIWDKAQIAVISTSKLTVAGPGSCVNPKTPNDPAGSCDLGDLPVFRWFGRFDTAVFFDANENGYWDSGESTLLEQGINLRFRNGVIYQGNVTDLGGLFTFEKVFPFFNWLVAEVGFSGFKATGATFIVDAGGGTVAPLPGETHGSVSDGTAAGDLLTHDGTLVPQPQFCTADDVAGSVDGCAVVGAAHNNPNTGNNLSRTETGPVLTAGIQTFLGQSNYIEWGKYHYGPGENGGISGMAYYGVTRAEDDPRYAAVEPWEPGIPRVVVNLYADGDTNNIPWGTLATTGPCTGLYPAGPEDVDWNGNSCIDFEDNVIDSLNGNASVDLADVDNYPFGNFPGAEDINHTNVSDPGQGYTNEFDYGDAIQITTSDSWDDNLPTGCQGAVFTSSTGVTTDCFDGLRNFNQIRPAVFDGGYAFDSYFAGGMGSHLDVDGDLIVSEVTDGLPAAGYIVAAITPPGHELITEASKNVDFGEVYSPNTALLPPICVGEDSTVPQYLTFQTDTSGAPLPGIVAADLIEAPFTGTIRPLCDRKKISLLDGMNAAADFGFFTEVPKASHVTGMVLNDLANEFDPNAPAFGEKAAPPFVPISFRDWSGREIVRVYSDEFGLYNALLPSSFTANAPSPSGYSPAMYTACMNDAGPIEDGDGNPIIDPFFNRQLSQFCYTFQYMPGATTILDTPVVPVAAFARNGTFPVDCEFPDETPGIYSVSRQGGNGPLVQPNDLMEIISAGTAVLVPNPLHDGIGGVEPLKIPRNHSFGGNIGDVELIHLGTGAATVLTADPAMDAATSWGPDMIVARIPGGLAAGEYQLKVTTTGNKITDTSVTVTVVPSVAGAGGVHFVSPDATPLATPIQDAIEAAQDGDLILVAPGTYDELVWLHKPVKIQGWGSLSATINARQSPAEKLEVWREKKLDLVNNTTTTEDDFFCLLPDQDPLGFNAGNNEPELFGFMEGAGITVVGDCGQNGQPAWEVGQARIDGLQITGGSSGGGIFVAQHANNLVISNNRIVGNVGTFGGGITVGDSNPVFNGVSVPSVNNDIIFNHNQIIENGAINGAGGGISLYNDSNNYSITNSYICGNFTQGSGAGIGHLGKSNNGMIQANKILFNQSFDQATNPSGGGISIAGLRLANPVLGNPPLLTEGAGNVTIRENLIQGNQSGAGNGGGVSLEFINGEDVVANPTIEAAWFKVDLFNNMIVNNVAGLAGGGISLQDAVRVRIYNDSVANNDSTATTSLAFQGSVAANLTVPQPAGIVSHSHSALLAALANEPINATVGDFSDADIINSIVWHNRSFCWGATAFDQLGFPTVFGLMLATDADCGGAASEYEDLAVLPRGSMCLVQGNLVPCQLNPISSALTDVTGFDQTNMVPTLPLGPFVQAFPITDAGQTINQPEATIPVTAEAFDEGGNFIDVRFGPLEPTGDYHLDGNSILIDHVDSNFTVLGPLNFNGSAVDFDFQLRLNGGFIDIGADEAQQSGGGGPTGLDSDADGFPDNADNCVNVANADQRDTNGDGYGNVCDADLNNDGMTDYLDLGLFSSVFFSSDADADFNGDGTVDYLDLGTFSSYFFQAPGPSGIAP